MCKKSKLSLTAAGLLMALTAIADTNIRVVAEFPSGTFLENLVVMPEGDTVFTSYFSRQIKTIHDNDALNVLVNLPVHPVGILSVGDGYVITAHGSSFTEGPEFTQVQQILMLSATGDITATIPVPDALFLNGMAQLADGRVLIADSIAGTIWHFDLATRAVSPWLRHELLAQNPNLAAFAPGANGLKLDGPRLLVSNSGRGALYQIAIDQDGQAVSDPTIVAQTGAIDDFYVDDERIIFTTHGDALQAVEPDGTITTVLAEGCDGCTSVARRGDAYLVLTTGGLLEGHSEPARILEIPVQ